jgi:hypothetical protein
VMETKPSEGSTVARDAAVAGMPAFRPAPNNRDQLARMSDHPAPLPPLPPSDSTHGPRPDARALSTVERHGPPRGAPQRDRKSTDSGRGELLAGMSDSTKAPTISDVPPREPRSMARALCRRGCAAVGGCAGGLSTPVHSDALLVGMSRHADQLRPSEPTVNHRPARGRGALDRGADAAPRGLRRRLRYPLTPFRVCDPARLWMTAKTKSITRDIARLLLRASVAPRRADICRASLATSGGRP